MGAWDELDTKVNVNLNTDELDEFIEFLESDPVLKPAVELAQKYRNGIVEGSKIGAKRVSEANKSFQELAIASNATFTSTSEGSLLRSIEIEKESETSFIIGTNIAHFYPLCVERGRREVRPVYKKFLHWYTLSGDEVFSKYSSPAPPRPFVKPAYERTVSEGVDIVKEAIYDATIG